MGEHQRQSQAERKRTYVAGVDLAGEHEHVTAAEGTLGNQPGRGQDSTLITIAEVAAAGTSQPVLRIVEQIQVGGYTP